MKPGVKGKYLFVDDKKFIIKGVSYGNFDPNDTKNGTFFFDRDKTKKDFELIKKTNINTIRFYVKPPDYVMEIAKDLGLKVILTLYVDYLTEEINLKNKDVIKKYKELTKDLVKFGKKHGNVLMYLLGTEILGTLLEKRGIQEIENFIEKQGQDNFENFIYELHKTAKETDPNCLTSYANFSPTEFLNLDFLDVITFHVYLHTEEQFKNYLARLQNYAGNKPLLIGEMGADTLKEGEKFQAELLRWSINSTFEGGCCGSVVFTFADGWWSGEKVTGWQMGIMTEDRNPKLAYETVKTEFGKKNLFENLPMISVVIAGYNEEKHIAGCIEALLKSDYPKSKTEIIVVSDGSKDNTVKIAKKYPVKVVAYKENRGLSYARNIGAENAKGEIIAYTDGDCRVDVDWLYHIARSFDNENIGCVGGPNITPPEDPFLAQCTARAPGCPTHVLIDDTKADHVPGCNMAFRKSVLKEIGGFNEIFRIAGDDVDVGWKLQKAGYIVKYNPAAQVMHHRRNSIKAYIKQQFNYGLSEAFVRQAHPERFTGFHAIWKGCIYNTYNNAANDLLTIFGKPIIYFDWFPEIHKPSPNYLTQTPLDIRWHAVWIALLLLTPLSLIFTGISGVMFSVTMLTCFTIGGLSVKKRHTSKIDAIKEFFLISFLSFMWSFARKYGQFKGWILTSLNRDTLGRRLGSEAKDF